MNKKENMEQIIEYLLKQISWQKSWVRDARHKYEDTVEDHEDDFSINFYKERFERKKTELLDLENMLHFMQELHYEEESK